MGILFFLVFLIFLIFLFVKSSVYYQSHGVINLDGKLDKNELKLFKSIFITYFIWGCIQQAIIIFIYFCLSFLNKEVAFYISLAIFIGFHYPNIFLILATGFMESLFLNFLKNFNSMYVLIFIIPFGFIHGFAASILNFYYPPEIHRFFFVLKSFWDNYKKMRDKI